MNVPADLFARVAERAHRSHGDGPKGPYSLAVCAEPDCRAARDLIAEPDAAPALDTLTEALHGASSLHFAKAPDGAIHISATEKCDRSQEREHAERVIASWGTKYARG